MSDSMFAATIAGSLPKPTWLAEPGPPVFRFS